MESNDEQYNCIGRFRDFICFAYAYGILTHSLSYSQYISHVGDWKHPKAMDYFHFFVIAVNRTDKI